MQDVSTGETLDQLLAKAQEAGPDTRIELRDAIASFGEAAVEAMADWTGEPRLAAFAIRVLERIGREPTPRQAVVDVLRSLDRSTLSAPLQRDVDVAFDALGASPTKPSAAVRRQSSALGRPGVPGRGYWMMRTSQWERPFVWAEAQRGRLRQGWGSTPEQDLHVIARVRRTGGRLNDDQEFSVRSRRMNTAEPDGMRVGDVVATPNLPVWGRLSVFEVTGSYRYEMVEPMRWGERFGHILPVRLLAADIDRRSPKVSDGLRAMLRPQSRLFNISGYGGEVEALLGNDRVPAHRASDRWGELWTEKEYETLFGRFPPLGARPSDEQIGLLAAELGRTFDAISWQWADGASFCGGGSASTTSQPLKVWLKRIGACRT
jgi:hypothetical protein